jgi:hypothetical protein
MSGSRAIVNLLENRDTKITEIMDGPWRDVSITEFSAGEQLALISDAEEHAGFVIDGSCSLTTSNGTWPLTKNGAFALPLSGSANIIAGAGGLRLLLITLNVSVQGGRRD